MKNMAMAMLIISGLLSTLSGVAQRTEVSTIIARLQGATTSDAAVTEIEDGGPDLKSAIADKLPSLMMNAKSNDDLTVKNNLSKLAGELKVIASIPMLVDRFVKGDLLPTGFTSTMRWRMVDDPAGRALAQIGDPVTPYMSKLLKSDHKEDREKAIRVLGNIKSPTALEVMKEHRSSESDEYILYVIDKLTASQN